LPASTKKHQLKRAFSVDKHFLYALILALAACAVKAQDLDSVSAVKLSRNGDFVQLTMDIDIAKQKPPRKSLVLYTPRLVGEHDSIDFPEVVIFGRSTCYYARGGKSQLFKPDAYKIRHKRGPRSMHYARTIAHQPWMENSRLKIIRSDGTPCDGNVMERDGVLVADMTAFTLLPPDTTLIAHENKEQEELTGSVSGQARIQFIVNRTEFVPELANNRRELQSMHNSILEVQAGKCVQITKYRIKGYASPEGSWENNVRLAQGRTERLREFMVDQWGVPQNQIEIDYEPEDLGQIGILRGADRLGCCCQLTVRGRSRSHPRGDSGVDGGWRDTVRGWGRASGWPDGRIPNRWG